MRSWQDGDKGLLTILAPWTITVEQNHYNNGILLQRGKVSAICLFILICLASLVACRPVLDVQIALEIDESEPSLGKVAYIMGGDVWIYDLDTTQTVRLTQDGYNSHPQWSFDGSKIAYRKKEQLWVMELAAKQAFPVSELPVEWFSWLPSPSRLIYFSRGEGLMISDLTNNTTTPLIPISNEHSVENFVWDGEGKTLVFNKGSIVDGSYVVSLEKIDLEQNDTATLYKTSNMREIPLIGEVSPGGQWLAFWRWDTEITFFEKEGLPLCMISVSGGQAHCTASKAIPSREFLDWSLDSQLAYFTIEQNLVIAAPKGFSEQSLVDLAYQSPIYPAWAPDGEHIAYSATSIGVEKTSDAQNQGDVCIQRRIWVIEVGSKRLHQLTNDDRFCDELPFWSVDGKHILFARQDKENAGLWLMRSNGEGLTQIVSELTPKPEPLGEYGYIDWQAWWDWWRPGAP
jgi:dipeptidyl aminopeptidase/acylaminoacyl peptidase